MKYLILVSLLFGCEKIPDPPCRSGVAVKDPLNGLPHYVCDYRARSFPLSNGGVLCLCPEDVTKLTK